MGERVVLRSVASGRRRGASSRGEEPAAASSSGCGEGASVGVRQAATVCGAAVLGCLKVRGHHVGLLSRSGAAALTGGRCVPDGAGAAELVTGSG